MHNDTRAFLVQGRHIRVGMEMVPRITRLQRSQGGLIVHDDFQTARNKLVITFCAWAPRVARLGEGSNASGLCPLDHR